MFNQGIVFTIDHTLGIVKELELFVTLLFHRLKVFLVGGTHTGKHANGGLYNVAQGLHLVGLTDACLEDAHLALLVEQPY